MNASENIKASEQILLSRLTNRLSCRSCDAVYHTEDNESNRPTSCSSCGGDIYQRSDDTPEIAKKRLQVFHKQTEPLITHYEKMNKLIEVDGEQDEDKVTKSLLAAIKESLLH